MDKNNRLENLRKQITLVAEKDKQLNEALLKHKKYPERGDIYLFDLEDIPDDLAVFWVILHCHPEDSSLFFAIPADTNPLTGTCDVPIPPIALFGSLTLRLDHGLWLPDAIFQPLQRVGIVERLFIDRAQFIMSRIAKNEWIGSEIQQATETNPDYEEWMGMIDQVCVSMRSYREKPMAWDYITEGVKVFIDDLKKIISISGSGIERLKDILSPQPLPALGPTVGLFMPRLMVAYATRGATSGENLFEDGFDSRESLKEHFSLIPTDFLPMRNKTLKIIFTQTEHKILMKPVTTVSIRDKKLLSADVEWQSWTQAEAVLLVKNCDIKVKEQKKADTLMEIHYEGNVLKIDILPPASSVA